MKISLILGGARSGKSARALALAGHGPRTFVATAEALDDEMAERIARHRAERGADWRLIEAPLDLAPVVSAHREGVLVVDCLTLWLSNLMHAGRNIEGETAALVGALRGPESAPPQATPPDPIVSESPASRGHSAAPPVGETPSPVVYPPGEQAGAQPRIVLVSNEVGLSIAPENALARRFRDEQGRLNQRVAAVADHVEFIAAGLPLVLKGTP